MMDCEWKLEERLAVDPSWLLFPENWHSLRILVTDHITWKAREVGTWSSTSCTVSFGQGHKMDHLAETVHQRQEDGVATGKGKTGNKGRCAPLHSKHPLLPWKDTSDQVSGRRVLRGISIWEDVGPGLLQKSTGRALWWMSGGRCGHNEVQVVISSVGWQMEPDQRRNRPPYPWSCLVLFFHRTQNGLLIHKVNCWWCRHFQLWVECGLRLLSSGGPLGSGWELTSSGFNAAALGDVDGGAIDPNEEPVS